MTDRPVTADLRNRVSKIVHDDNLSLKAVVEELLDVIASVDENAHERGYTIGFNDGIDRTLYFMSSDPTGKTVAMLKAEAAAAVAAIQ